MSNEYRRVIMLHALTEICRILQIEENIPISCQTLTYTGRGMVAVHFLPESHYPERYTVKVIYKTSNLSNRIDQEAIKVPTSLGL